MDFETWLAIGREQGYCSMPACNTHDWVPQTPAELAEWDDGGDPCVHVIRLYESPEQMAEAETPQ